MNTENTEIEINEHQDRQIVIHDYQALIKDVNRKFLKYQRAIEKTEAALREWEAAQEIANEATRKLIETLK